MTFTKWGKKFIYIQVTLRKMERKILEIKHDARNANIRKRTQRIFYTQHKKLNGDGHDMKSA